MTNSPSNAFEELKGMNISIHYENSWGSYDVLDVVDTGHTMRLDCQNKVHGQKVTIHFMERGLQ